MTLSPERKKELLEALRRGRTDDPELDEILLADIEVIAPIIEQWLTKESAPSGR
jgi:hypothetical protein